MYSGHNSAKEDNSPESAEQITSFLSGIADIPLKRGLGVRFTKRSSGACMHDEYTQEQIPSIYDVDSPLQAKCPLYGDKALFL